MQIKQAEEYFGQLQEQINDGVIIEDEDDLARLAMLVPLLCAALRQCDATLEPVKGVLQQAERVITEIAFA